jgi:hypothetical protein
MITLIKDAQKERTHVCTYMHSKYNYKGQDTNLNFLHYFSSRL